jgi:hypothetical protein
LFALTPISAQTQEELFDGANIEQSINPLFPILPIIQTALNAHLTWQPEWFLTIPPDSFSLASGKAASIQLEIEGDNNSIFLCEWNDKGQIIQFPLLHETFGGVSFMAALQFNQAGEIAHIRLHGKQKDTTANEDSSAGKTESASEVVIVNEAETFSEIEITIEILETRDGYPLLARIHRNGEYYFAVFEYWNDSASETWYNADGSPQGLLLSEYQRYEHIRHDNTGYHPAGNDRELFQNMFLLAEESIWGNLSSRVTYDYDSWGNISQVNTETLTTSVLYNEDSRPKYLEKTFLEGYISPDAANNLSDEDTYQSFPQKEHFTFQWDEQNLLVSLKESVDNTHANDTITEKRYEYTLDERGNWIERREILMIRQGAYLFPSPGENIRRTIKYINP